MVCRARRRCRTLVETAVVRPPGGGVEDEELPRRALGVRGDFGLARRRPMPEQEADLEIAHDEAEKGAKRRLDLVEVEEARRPPRLQDRRQAPAEGDGAVFEDDRAEVPAIRPRLPDRHAVERHRGVAGQDRQPVRGEAPKARIEDVAIGHAGAGRHGADLGRLPLHRRGQKPVPPAEPLVERFLRAARAARHGRHGHLLAGLHENGERGFQHLPLPLAQRLGSDVVLGLHPAPPLFQHHEGAEPNARKPYRTLRYSS